MNKHKQFFNKGYWIIPLLIIFALWWLWSVREDIPQYRENGMVTVARITQLSRSSSGRVVSYAYQVGARRYDQKVVSRRQFELGTYVYVIYIKDNPEESILLTSRVVDIDEPFKGSVKEMGLTDKEIRDALTGKKQ